MRGSICWATSPEVVAVLLCVATCSSACFFRNCPLGGKRSLEHVTNSHNQRQCMACGPDGSGQCVGPSICCGLSFGCYVNTPESTVCEKENISPIACEVKGPVCGSEGRGHCVADKVCCTGETCSMDDVCEKSADDQGMLGAKNAPLNHRVIRYLSRLLRRRQGYGGESR